MAMRRILKLAAFSLLGTAGALATPAWADGGVWDHNGSRMTLEENGDKRKLVYTEPREGLDKAGIKKGTVLFNGEKKANGRFAGFAKIFKGTCNPIDYFVEGALDEQKGEIILQGQAPVYATGTGCEVSGYSDTSPASKLTFTRIGDAPETAVVAERTPEAEIEQGDRGPKDEYLPPSMRGGARNAERTAPSATPQQREATPQRETTPAPAPRREASPAPQRDEQPFPGATPRRDRAPTVQGRNDPADIDEGAPDDRDFRPRDRRYSRDDYEDRRYSRAPDPYQDRSYRRRPGIWEPEEEMDEDRYYEERYERRRFWDGWRRPY